MSRRRRNPIDATTLLTWGAIAVGAYLIYKTLFGSSGSVSSAVSQATQGIANTWVNLTSPAAPVPQGSVVMPNGTTFPASSLTNMQESFVGNTLTFVYSDGQTYQLAPQSGGSYQASLYTGS